MRRYELMLVLRPDTADDQVQQILDRTTRGIAASDGQIVKVSPWGRRRLAYPISSYREGSYFIIVFDAPGEAVVELERGLNIIEDVMRHLVTRIERPAGRRSEKADDEAEAAPNEAEAAPSEAEAAPSEAEAAPEKAAPDASEATAATDDDVVLPPPPDEDEPVPDGEFIDESESEAAPKAV